MLGFHQHYWLFLDGSSNYCSFHPCCTPVLYTSVVHQCCAPVLYTSVVHRCCTSVFYNSEETSAVSSPISLASRSGLYQGVPAEKTTFKDKQHFSTSMLNTATYVWTVIKKLKAILLNHVQTCFEEFSGIVKKICYVSVLRS